jgi:hypothetical protein
MTMPIEKPHPHSISGSDLHEWLALLKEIAPHCDPRNPDAAPFNRAHAAVLYRARQAADHFAEILEKDNGNEEQA